ncbi:MAG: DUF4364 family protein [Lachnospirales bacterium]
MDKRNTNETLQKSNNKFIILFFLLKYDAPISSEELNGFILEYELIDYFIFSSLLEEMCENFYVENYVENSIKYYSITDEGISMIESFEKLIPMSARTQILRYVDLNKKNVERKNEVSAHYFNDKETNSWKVKGNISDSDFVMMEFTLTFFTESEAAKATANWQNNCSENYRVFLEKITEEIKKQDIESPFSEEDVLKILEKGKE